jgi:Ran GTPase-activating protein (RanGAP) involved in mRNA processing and transport
VRAERATIVIPKPHNNSLTDLRLTNNDMGEQAAAVITRILSDEDNRTIQSLYLDFNISMRPKDLKNIIKSIFKYNLTLETFSLSDIPITMKNFEGVLKIIGHSKPGPPISKLMIARCGINSEYLRNISNIMRMGGQYLRYLDISGNLLGDEGIRLLSEGLIASGAMSKQKRRDLQKDEFDENSSTQSSVPGEGFGFDMSSSLLLQASSHTMEGISPSTGPPKRVVDHMQQKLAAKQSLYTDAILKIELTVQFIPLRFLDVSSCRMESIGLLHLLSNIKFLSTLQILDISNNNIGPRPFQTQRGRGGKGHEDDDIASVSSGDTSTRQDDIEEIADMLKSFALTELKMNNCRLYTKGANAIIGAMADTSEGCCGATLVVLQLSGNEIYDSFSSTLLTFLHTNATLQVLDLGFNRFTNQFDDRVRGVYQTTSTSRDEFKLNNLTVNLVGNECDRLLLDTPGLARAKSTNIFRSNQHSSISSYDHISLQARSGFLARLKLDNEAYARKPTAKINFIA